MAMVGPATSRRTSSGDSYASQWNRFVPWSQTSGAYVGTTFGRPLRRPAGEAVPRRRTCLARLASATGALAL